MNEWCNRPKCQERKKKRHDYYRFKQKTINLFQSNIKYLENNKKCLEIFYNVIPGEKML